MFGSVNKHRGRFLQHACVSRARRVHLGLVGWREVVLGIGDAFLHEMSQQGSDFSVGANQTDSLIPRRNILRRSWTALGP